MRRTLAAIAAVTAGLAGAALFSSGVVSAHDPGFSLSCEGARLTGSGYDDGDTNVATIEIDGVAVFHIDDFGTTLDHTEPVPQDGVVHSVHFVLDAQGPATEDHPEYDLDVTQIVGPCGEVTTTSPESSTTSPESSSTSPESSTTSPESSSTSPESSTTSPESSTTSPESSTTSPGTISIAAFSPVCLRDAPYVDVTFGDQSEFNGRTATVTFIDLDGNVVETHTTTFQAGATKRFIYPGAEVDANGNPIDWPGWLFDGDEWVIDPSDARLRDGLRVVVEVNPTATGTVDYPPATPDCDASPPGTPEEPPTGTLPTTGRDSSSTVVLATAVLIGGVVLFALARLRIAKK
jgi:hypothetical protein